MAMFAPIPLPGIDNPQFKDVMDYFEQLQKRKAQQQQFAEEQKRLKEQFGQTKELENKKLEELIRFHQGTLNQNAQTKPLQMELLKARIEALKNPTKTVAKETPEERQQREVSTAKSKKEDELNLKKIEEYLSAGDIVNKYSPNLETIHGLLTEDPWTTGNIAGVKNLAHMGGEHQGQFNAATLPLVGKLAKDISQRGGAVAAGMATAGKPSLWQSNATNLGLTKQLIEESLNTYNEAKKGYEELTGKSYPKKLPKFLQEYQSKMSGGKPPPGTVLMYKKGKKYHIPENEAKEAETAGYTYGG